jgi:hypothetical protein
MRLSLIPILLPDFHFTLDNNSIITMSWYRFVLIIALYQGDTFMLVRAEFRLSMNLVRTLL